MGNLKRGNNTYIYLLYHENFNPLSDYSITIRIEFYDICEVVMKISEKFVDSSRIVQVYTISTTGRYFWRCEGNIQIVHQEHETFSANTVAPLWNVQTLQNFSKKNCDGKLTLIQLIMLPCAL